MINDWVRHQAQKRGGGQSLIPIDENLAERLYQQETSSATPAEKLYDKRWALALLDGAMNRLRAEYFQAGKGNLFDRLKESILTEGSGERFRAIGTELGMNEGAVKVALHRLRGRFREVVREEVAQTVPTFTEVDEELRSLMAALNS